MTDRVAQAIPHTSPSQLNTHQCIKLLALVLMTIDHVGEYLHPDILWLRAIGRLCPPIWFFLIGHALTYRVRYDTILWALVLADLNPVLGQPFFPLNVLPVILFCQWVLPIIERRGLLAQEPLMLCLVGILFCLPTSLFTEYGTQGFLFALMGYAVRSEQMTWRSGKLVSVTALGLYLAMQLLQWPFNTAQVLLIIVGTSIVTVYLAQFRWRPIRTAVPRVVARPLVFLSRHSLQYYVVHRVLIEAVGLVSGMSISCWCWSEAL